MKLPIPVNVITGSLGSGKTTAISHLLGVKSTFAPDEKWAILVNEFGALGIDGAVLDNARSHGDNANRDAVVVRELAGGCLCCTLSGPLGIAIAQLVRNAKPDRLIIEPSGLGHPAGLLDTLQNEHLKSALLIQAIICLVDVRLIGSPEFISNQAYQDQINVADIVIGTKVDVASPEEVEEFVSFAAELYPPKVKVLTAFLGRIDACLLNEARLPVFRPLFSEAHSSRRRLQQQRLKSQSVSPTEVTGQAPLQMPSAASGMGAAGPSPGSPAFGDQESIVHMSPGVIPDDYEGPQQDWRVDWASDRPARLVSDSSPDHLACGWLYPPGVVFKAEALLKLCDALLPVTARVKGVFRLGKEWSSLVQRDSGQGLQLVPMAYRKDSRLEIILPTAALKSKLSGSGQTHFMVGAGPEGVVLAASLENADWVDAAVGSVLHCDWDGFEQALRSHVVVVSQRA